MKRQMTWAAVAAIALLSACEKKAEENAAAPATAPEAAANAPAAAGANPTAATATNDAAARQKATQELQARLDGASGKLDALKQKASTGAENAQLKEQCTALTTKLEGARTELKALGQTTDATWGESKAKAEKNIQELETSLEQVGNRPVN